MGHEFVAQHTHGHSGRKDDKSVRFTSKTLIGVYEEIDRFIKENPPGSLRHFSRSLVPAYSEDTDLEIWPPERQWTITMIWNED